MKKKIQIHPKKNKDQNAKSKKWQVPVELNSAKPEEYPDRHEQSPK